MNIPVCNAIYHSITLFTITAKTPFAAISQFGRAFYFWAFY